MLPAAAVQQRGLQEMTQNKEKTPGDEVKLLDRQLINKLIIKKGGKSTCEVNDILIFPQRVAESSPSRWRWGRWGLKPDKNTNQESLSTFVCVKCVVLSHYDANMLAPPPHPGLTTSSTVLLTASDTLCRTSAAVPGLLSLLVNFRTSDMMMMVMMMLQIQIYRLNSEPLRMLSCIHPGIHHTSTGGRSSSADLTDRPTDAGWGGAAAGGGGRRRRVVMMMVEVVMWRRDGEAWTTARRFTLTHFRSDVAEETGQTKIVNERRVLTLVKHRVKYL